MSLDSEGKVVNDASMTIEVLSSHNRQKSIRPGIRAEEDEPRDGRTDGWMAARPFNGPTDRRRHNERGPERVRGRGRGRAGGERARVERRLRRRRQGLRWGRLSRAGRRARCREGDRRADERLKKVGQIR